MNLRARDFETHPYNMGILGLNQGCFGVDQEPSHFAHEFSLQLAALLGQAALTQGFHLGVVPKRKKTRHVDENI